MSLLCFAGSHAPGSDPVNSQGLCFSSCTRCGRNLVRAALGWQPVPKGFRIVWKAGSHSGAERSLPLAGGPATIAPSRPARARHFGFGELVSMGVRLLAWHGADGFRRWRDSLVARRFRQPVALLLTAD